MEFIVFIEHNHKENETFVIYLQYTNNEESLKKLEEFINTADYSFLEGGDYSDFEIDMSVKFSEDMVDQHCKLSFGTYSHMFQKVSGKFVFPFEVNKLIFPFDTNETSQRVLNSYEKAKLLDQYFYHCCIRGCYKE